MTGDCKSLQPLRSRPTPTSAQSTTVDFATVAAVSNRQVRSCRATASRCNHCEVGLRRLEPSPRRWTSQP
jgi:hypothetical protein